MIILFFVNFCLAFLPLEADDVKSCRNKWCGVAIPMNGINPECIPAEHYCNPQGTTTSPQDLCDDQNEFTSDPLCKIISPATPDGNFQNHTIKIYNY